MKQVSKEKDLEKYVYLYAFIFPFCRKLISNHLNSIQFNAYDNYQRDINTVLFNENVQQITKRKSEIQNFYVNINECINLGNSYLNQDDDFSRTNFFMSAQQLLCFSNNISTGNSVIVVGIDSTMDFTSQLLKFLSALPKMIDTGLIQNYDI